MRLPRALGPLAMVVLPFLAPASALADAATEAKLRDALRSTTAQLHALEDERAKWKDTETQLRQELETLRAQPAPKNQDRTVTSLNRRLSEQNTANLKLREALDLCRAQNPGKLPAVAAQADAAAADPEKAALTATVKKLNERLVTAESQNASLYQVGKDLIDWMVQVGVPSGEPFLGLKRVQLENIAQSYEEKLHEHRIGS